MAYYPDTWTDKELEALEKRIAKVFKQAEKDLDKEVKEYFAKFALRDKEMQQLVQTGDVTPADYQRWRMTQIGRGQRFEALRDKVAERYTQANEVANAYVNDMTPSIYSLNRNYEAYTIEKTVGSCDFTMWDESTVRRLLVEQPDLMPYYPPSRALNRGIDLAYGKSQITKHVTSGIIRGLAPGKIASELMSNITTMNRESAVRAARTGITAAQNAGRMDSYVAAEKMGIQIKRRWVCTKDSRTRLAHGMADGQIVVGTKKPFNVGGELMMFPGDKSMGAHGWNIYNCRCTTRTVEKDGIEAEPREMRVRNPKTGEWELVNEMTYSEWMEWKKTGTKPARKEKAAADLLPKAKPTRPRKRDFDSDEAYQEAREKYRAEKAAYDEQIDRIVQSALNKTPRFQTKVQVIEWTKKNGIQIDRGVFETVDLRAFNEVSTTLEELFERYPQIKSYEIEDFTGAKFMTSFNIGLTDEGLLSANGGFNFNGRRFADYEDGLREAIDQMAEGYLVRGDGSFSTLVRHEFGHNVQNYIEFSISNKYHHNVDRWQTYFKSLDEYKKNDAAYWKELHTYRGELMELAKTEGVSEYARTNELELFAEGFAEFASGGSTEFGKAFGKFLERWYK